MMDHHELPKGRFPDTLKDEDIQDRYILRGPPTGQVLGVRALTVSTYVVGFSKSFWCILKIFINDAVIQFVSTWTSLEDSSG